MASLCNRLLINSQDGPQSADTCWISARNHVCSIPFPLLSNKWQIKTFSPFFPFFPFFLYLFFHTNTQPRTQTHTVTHTVTHTAKTTATHTFTLTWNCLCVVQNMSAVFRLTHVWYVRVVYSAQWFPGMSVKDLKYHRRD